LWGAVGTQNVDIYRRRKRKKLRNRFLRRSRNACRELLVSSGFSGSVSFSEILR